MVSENLVSLESILSESLEFLVAFATKAENELVVSNLLTLSYHLTRLALKEKPFLVKNQLVLARITKSIEHFASQVEKGHPGYERVKPVVFELIKIINDFCSSAYSLGSQSIH